MRSRSNSLMNVDDPKPKIISKLEWKEGTPVFPLGKTFGKK